MRTVIFPDTTPAPALGQGTWRMGEDPRLRQQETAALRAGIDLGMTLIDTAEMYGDGATETLLGEALAGLRDQVFLVSKVYPQNAGRGRIERACEASLQRLKTDHLDLYLLHWRGSRAARPRPSRAWRRWSARGRSARWGVSNLDHGDMEQLVRAGGDACATDQILYNVTERGAEFDLLPQLRQREIPAMAYSPVGQGRLPASPALAAVAHRHERDAVPGGSGLGAARSGCHRHPQGQRRGSRRREPPRPGFEADRLRTWPRSTRSSRRRRGRRAWRCSDGAGDGALAALERRKPGRIGRVARHVAVEVRRAIGPPDGSALAERPLGLIDRGMGLGFGRPSWPRRAVRTARRAVIRCVHETPAARRLKAPGWPCATGGRARRNTGRPGSWGGRSSRSAAPPAGRPARRRARSAAIGARPRWLISIQVGAWSLAPSSPLALAVDPGGPQRRRQVGAEQQVVQPHALVVRPAVTQVAPEGPERSLRLERAQGVGPALVQQALERGAGLRLQQGVGLLVVARARCRPRSARHCSRRPGRPARPPPSGRRRGRSAARTRPACRRTSGPAADCRWAGRSRRSGRR